MLHYAETHFGFKFSRLFRKEPVILIDAPFQVVPNAECPIWIIARNADRFPTQINEIYGEWKNAKGETIPFKIPFEKKLNQPFHFEELTAAHSFSQQREPSPMAHGVSVPPSRSGIWQLQIFINYEINGKKLNCERWNYPHLPPRPITVHFLSENPPKPENWLAGETHCHSNYTSDSIEFGASLSVLQKAAKCVGLDFACITDHSYDLMNDENFQQFRKEIAELNADDGDASAFGYEKPPILIAGEEISCGNGKGENVHLLSFGNEHYVEGHGDGGRRWWNTNPDLRISDAIEKSGAFCFAAHPKIEMLSLEKLLLKRGHWNFEDVAVPVVANQGDTAADLLKDDNSSSAVQKRGGAKKSIIGIEFWNGFRGRDFYEGRELWIKCLLAGYKLLPLGGNDAHGDLNSYTAMKTPLWSLKCNNEHIFGVVRTNIPNLGTENPFAKIPENLYVSDGPALWFDFPQGGKKPILHARTTSDFGNFISITIFYGKVGGKEELSHSSDFYCHSERSGDPCDLEYLLGFPENSDYIRAECETDKGKFAMTSAVWKNS